MSFTLYPIFPSYSRPFFQASLMNATSMVKIQQSSLLKGLNYSNSRSLWRSVEWIEHFLFSFPSIISPRFKEENTTVAVKKLVRACLLAMQWSITKDELTEIESLIKHWFTYLDQLVTDKRISKTIFTFNHHVRCHIPYLIRKLGPLRAFSARSLERKVGTAKRSVRSTKNAGINAGNILEKEEIFNFLSM
ncbi:hypothetical protein K501DRAFT_232612, partial [Backusella circina FSU 941]